MLTSAGYTLHRCSTFQIGWAKSHTKLSKRVQCVDCGTWAERRPNMRLAAFSPSKP